MISSYILAKNYRELLNKMQNFFFSSICILLASKYVFFLCSTHIPHMCSIYWEMISSLFLELFLWFQWSQNNYYKLPILISVTEKIIRYQIWWIWWSTDGICYVSGRVVTNSMRLHLIIDQNPQILLLQISLFLKCFLLHLYSHIVCFINLCLLGMSPWCSKKR